MAETKNENDNPHIKTGNFICGVVEGFYGRPWTTEQRKDLFQKLKKWGMDSYLYAPKDDYKHRAYWRELYTVEEAEHLTSLITAARENNITFYYALSPGLDITYSSSKEVSCLKRKLEQVAQFGCTAFALLFDDIEPEMSESDKEVFQSFAQAQVSVTNEVYQHTSQPKFLFCPTQYCAVRAMPNVQNSEYLNTIGAKLASSIDIMWTGPKVITKTLTLESIEEITEVLRRPPVIWDNLHANDYDQKRVFLGPYSGRSPDLIQKLRGVLLNPNCEYGANFIAIHTLAQWSRCSIDGKRELNDTVSADIKLETEGEEGSVDEAIPSDLSPTSYHPKQALRNAIQDWLYEFKRIKVVWGPIQRPQIVAAPVPVIPSVNTCMSVTTTTSSSPTGSGGVPALTSINTNQLQILAEVNNDILNQSQPNTVMNSLAAENKVVCNDTMIPSLTPSGEQSVAVALPNPLEPMDCNPSLSDHSLKPSENIPDLKDIEDVPMADENTPEINNIPTLTMESEVMLANGDCLLDTPTSNSSGMIVESPNDISPREELCYEDLSLLCDLFYLPFEHGAQGLHILQEFNWLKINANLVIEQSKVTSMKPEVQEWFERVDKFNGMSQALNRLFTRLTFSSNRELLYDLYPYVWDMRGVVSLMDSYLKWLGFSKGWKEAYTSGDQEPWVFRGGLTADLQRLIPVDSGNDLFTYKAPDAPSSKIYTIRPYLPSDESAMYDVCRRTCIDGMDGTDAFSIVPNLIGDKLIGAFICLSPGFCFIVEDGETIIGYALAALDSKDFHQKMEVSWIPELCSKYPKPLKEEGDMLSRVDEVIMSLHHLKNDVPASVLSSHGSVVHICLMSSILDQSVAKRLVTCLLASLRANGSFGCYAEVSSADKYLIEFYGKLGLQEISGAPTEPNVYLGRSF